MTPKSDTERHPFVLSRPHGAVVAHGSSAAFDAVGPAIAALRSGAVPAVVGALPFDRNHPTALTVPLSMSTARGAWAPEKSASRGGGTIPAFTVDDSDASAHLDRIDTAVRLLRSTTDPLRKVVLARRITMMSTDPVEPLDLLSALVDGTPAGNGYCVDLSGAGGTFAGASLVGSSPEVLVRRRGNTVTCHPLAGSAGRHPDPTLDRERGEELAGSAKDLEEHAFVVDAIRTALAPLCERLDIPDGPTLTHTPQLWHLGTPIVGTLRAAAPPSALELAAALHPTPAVCGTPTDLAYEVIDELEGDRGFYGGAVGWCDADGDGEWMVAIRCALIRGDRRHVTAYAGGGIVAGSDPQSELRETEVKFGTVLQALGVRSA